MLPAVHTTADAAMAHALALATDAVGLSDPNPRVGCVLVDETGHVLGTGHTQAAGGAHAEVMALRDAAARGHTVAGATAYVTLEPCSHHGRTPPCCDALIQAQIGRVVAACTDPNPLVAGQGVARLRAAGISVELGLLEEQARELNIGFFSRMQRQRPFLRMKAAASLDGRTALNNGVSQWITSAEARLDGHRWRQRAGAILTGIGTVREDNPRLDVRGFSTPLQPLRVVVDSQLQCPPTARILEAPGHALVVAGHADLQSAAARALRAAGAELVALPGPTGKVDLPALLRLLAERGVNELHVEAGHKLNGSLLREGLVDELLLYLAPKLLGPGREIAAMPELQCLDAVQSWVWQSCERVGADLRLRLRPQAPAIQAP